MLRSAIQSGDPVAYFEHKELWADEAEVDESHQVLLGHARTLHEGADLSIISWSKAAQWSLAAARLLAEKGIRVDVIDLRTLWPWDREAVFESVAKTGRALIVHEAVQVAGFGAEIAAVLAEESSAKVARLGRFARAGRIFARARSRSPHHTGKDRRQGSCAAGALTRNRCCCRLQ